MKTLPALIAFPCLLLLACQDNSGKAPGRKTTMAMTSAPKNPVQCRVPADCKGRIRIQCVGQWSCQQGKCVYHCTSGTPVLLKPGPAR